MLQQWRQSPLLDPLRPVARTIRKMVGAFRRELSRRDLLGGVSSSEQVLEIGPFTAANLLGANVLYFDVLDKENLINRANELGYPLHAPVDIDYVSPNGDLSVVPDAAFDVVLSSHCIEHQPDLVMHLQHVGRILKPRGRYLVVIPDKRYCFDHFIEASTLEAVLEAHAERRTLHTVESLLTHYTRTTHNDPARHWAGDHGQEGELWGAEGIERMKAELAAKQGAYIDTHAWQFTPANFRSIVSTLHARGLVPLSPQRVWQTPPSLFEFCAVLVKR